MVRHVSSLLLVPIPPSHSCCGAVVPRVCPPAPAAAAVPTEGAVCGQSLVQREQTLTRMEALLQETGFPYYLASLEQVGTGWDWGARCGETCLPARSSLSVHRPWSCLAQSCGGAPVGTVSQVLLTRQL